MSFALVSYYLPATGHKRRKKKEVSALRVVVACLCSVVGLGRTHLMQKAPKQRYLEEKVESAGFSLPHGILRVEF